MAAGSQIFANLVVHGLDLGEIVYEPNVGEPEHLHEHAHFYLGLAGRCTEFYCADTQEHHRFTIGFLPAGHSHSLNYHKSGFRWFRMNIHPSYLDGLRQYFETTFSPLYSRGGLLTELFLRLHREYRFPDAVSPIVIEALALEMLGEVSRRGTMSDRKPPIWLLRTRDFLEEHFKEQLSLFKIAETVDMHPVHIAREFRKHFNCTVGEYIRNRRVEYVCGQLAGSTAPLVDIALAAGFCDQSHLSRIFKRTVGTTPTRYRKSLA